MLTPTVSPPNTVSTARPMAGSACLLNGLIDAASLFALIFATSSFIPQRHLVLLPLEGSSKAQLCWAFVFTGCWPSSLNACCRLGF